MEPAASLSSWDHLNPGSEIDFSFHRIPEDKEKSPSYLSLSLSDETVGSSFILTDDISDTIQIDDKVSDDSPKIQMLYPVSSEQSDNVNTSVTNVLRSFKRVKRNGSNDHDQVGLPRLLDANSKEQPDSYEMSCRKQKTGYLLDNQSYELFEKCYKCEDCGRKFREKRNLASHARAHVGVRKYMCSECDRCFKTKSNLKVHLSTHSVVPFTCETCNKVFSTRNKLHRHSRLTHWNNHFECSHCGKILKSERSLRTHSASHSTDSRPFKCAICPRGFIFKNTLLAHIKLKHSCSSCSETGGRCTAHAFTCEKCGKSFSHQNSLSAHMSKHVSAKPHKCLLCGESYAKKDSLETHIKRMHNKEQPQFICDKCSQGYHTKFSLQRHYAKHTTSKTFICDLCKKSFWTKDALKVHGRSHEPVKKFICPVCGKRFTYKHSLVIHIRTHSDSNGSQLSISQTIFKINNQVKRTVNCRKISKENLEDTKRLPEIIGVVSHNFVEASEPIPAIGEWLERQPKSSLTSLYSSASPSTAYQDISHNPFL